MRACTSRARRAPTGKPSWSVPRACRSGPGSKTCRQQNNRLISATILLRPGMSDSGDDFYRRVCESARIGIYETSGDGRLLRANAYIASMFGYPDAQAMLEEPGHVGDRFYARRADRDRFAETLRREGSVQEFVCEGKRRGGGRVWFSQTAVRDIGPAGERFVGTMLDVTALMEARERAVEAEAAYRSIFENSSLGLFRSTPDGRQLRGNPALVRLNGYETESQLLAAVNDIGKEWYVEPGRRDEFLRLIGRDGRVVNFVSEVYRHRTRERIWVSENAWIVRRPDGGVLCFEGTIEDITERHQVQERVALARAAAEQAEADYRSMFENADFGIYRTRPDGIQIRSNAALARINGFASEAEQLEAVRKATISGKGWYVDPSRRTEFQRILHRDGYIRNFESEVIRRATGEHAWVSENGWLVRDREGHILAYEGTVTDITERKRAEAELYDAKSAAESASAAKSAFLAVMSHELRTPLNAIIGFAEIIETRMFGPDDPRYFEYAADIRSSGTHLLRLINDILDLSKITAGRLDLIEVPVALEPLLSATIKLFAANATKAEVELVADVPEGCPEIRADALRLQQVLMNLVSNAIKFTPAGGRVVVFARCDVDAIRIGVRDTGVGMTQAEARAAMEPFVQLDSRLSRSHEGTGLGLSISKELVTLHGGTFSIESEKGKGTTVTAELPLSRIVG
ncbi:MAG: PAS domain S-box protein [Alphaproteobacteria bacterium]|nr:PAS domain S-box protein [Alphaproteobacteria bacterium]